MEVALLNQNLLHQTRHLLAELQIMQTKLGEFERQITAIGPPQSPAAVDEFFLPEAASYTMHWGDGDEKIVRVRSGVISYKGGQRAVKLGFVEGGRWVAGMKDRVRGTVWIDDWLACEFAGADGSDTCEIASLVKLDGEMLPSDAEAPPEYVSFGLKVGPYRDIVKGPHAIDRLAMICAQDDYRSMIKHALIRWARYGKK